MSYRAFKRLLGETSLERKCRFLFGAATLLLITASFYWYARQTDELAYSQMATAGGFMVGPILNEQHNKIVPRQQENLDGEEDKGGKRQSRNKDSLRELVGKLQRAQEESKRISEATMPEIYKTRH